MLHPLKSAFPLPPQLMNSILTCCRRSLSRRQHAFTLARGAIRRQHTESAPRPNKNTGSPPKKSSRIGVAALVLVGVAGGYAARSLSTDKDASRAVLNNSSFSPFILVDREKVSSTSSIFALEQPGLSSDTLVQLWKDAVWSIEIKQPQLQIARAYTPLPPLDPSHADNQLRLLIRKERNGEVSGYIHATPDSGRLDLRGPSVEYQLPENVGKVVFLAGGTGIAPAIQVAYALQGTAPVHVLWANRRREDCQGGISDTVQATGSWLSRLGVTQGHPSASDEGRAANAIVRQLNSIKACSSTTTTVDYFVDEEKTFISPRHVTAALSPQSDTAAFTTSQKKLIIVSGPEGFVNYWAGPKEWRDGKEVQGPLGGALSNMDLRGWEVVKL